MANKIVEWLKKTKKKIARINDTPEKIALGFALGTFIGIFPTFYLGGIITLLFSAIFRLNYIAAILGTIVVMNPITTPIFWGLSAFIGSLIFSEDTRIILAQIKNGQVFKSLGDITLVYLTGNLIISSIMAIISYYFVKRLVVSYRKGRTV